MQLFASRPRLRLSADGPAFALGRVHEAAGPARRTLAAMVAGRTTGPVLWILGGREGATWRWRLDPEGLMVFFDPSRLVVARASRGVEALWAAEEALRSGAAPLVVLEPARPPALTPVRRLQLAAEAGAESEAAGGGAPLCLILTAEGGSAAAVETRWWASPLPGWALGGRPGGGGPRWRLALLRDKAGPPGVWEAGAPSPPLSPLEPFRPEPEIRPVPG